MPSLTVLVLVALSGIQGALAQTSHQDTIKGDSFKNCLQPYYSAPPCAKLNPAGTSQLLMQPDGNAVIYSVWYATNCNQGRGCVSPIWSLSFRVQDGRFVLSTTPDLSGQVVWGTKAGSVAGTQLCMQNDSNLVLYDGATPVWASGN
ncbi:hypothetical protein BCR33DRAFT_726565 [Rhizoclosmatium globosum]|uniref:Bulb-type lectin domain-containing protein n=1 Tax=Rhizoclosmatium globosum TaxID=329046 RepID=A0A1Y2ATY8_9FUNG|nr:hypothetical protein BCR33DRAFT_726565 [Rhizoclosmatium globosum]|eukprot:ORY26012.1 hypothetical protein BCR33DRAFT_726565 [Rhizoclosmatium globosum]